MNTGPQLPIVVGIDGSAPSYLAIDWAATEAGRRGAPLRLVHAIEWYPDDVVPADVPPDLAPEHVREAALARARAGAPEASVTVDSREGVAAAVLIEESEAASLVVVGNRGMGGFRGLLAGSVSVQTAAHAHCPVVVVRPWVGPTAPGVEEPSDAQGSAADRIVVGVDGSDRSDHAVGFAFQEAMLRGVGLTVVHAWRYPLSTSPGELTYAVVERPDLTELKSKRIAASIAHQRERYPAVEVRQVLAQGNPAAVLVQESFGTGLLVVGSRGHGGFTGLLLGSISDALIRHAGCPVAVVR